VGQDGILMPHSFRVEGIENHFLWLGKVAPLFQTALG
jgi:hypothetical protein